MIVTESDLREQWRGGAGRLPEYPPGTRFTESAMDFLEAHGLEVRCQADEPAPPGAGSPGPEPAWDRPGAFPVVQSETPPVCCECGQPVESKPDHMTQLDALYLAPKTTPRLKFRGQVDSLHALVMLAAACARRCGKAGAAARLDTLAAFCREILSAEYHGRPVGKLELAGKNEDELREISHRPESVPGMRHIVPGPDDHEVLHWLNVVRTRVREVECTALEAMVPRDLAVALNRLSSAVYVLELWFRAGRLD